MRVVITGGSGFIGRHLIAALRARGDEGIALPRGGDLARAAEGAHGVVNLSGEPVAGGRWTRAHKDRILESRVASTRRVVEAIAAARQKPRVLVNGSAQGYYGFHQDEDVDESSPAGTDFLAAVCAAWEAEARKAPTRVVLLRTGIVLGRDGGALPRMELPFKLFLGGRAGSGRQWMSWIHIADEVRMILWALDDARVEGPLNATSPAPVTNADFARALGGALRRPAFLPAPAFALRLALGELASVILEGARVLPRRAQELGFAFQFPDLEPALADLHRKTA